MMAGQSPAANFIARANREEAKLLKALDELQIVGLFIQHSELPKEIKFRLYSALKREHEMLNNDQARIDGLRKAAEISRGPQWITSGDNK
jgi:hypothetical protein